MPISIYHRLYGTNKVEEISISEDPAWFNDRRNRDSETTYAQRDFPTLSFERYSLDLMLLAAQNGMLNGQGRGGKLVDFFPSEQYRHGIARNLYDQMVALLEMESSSQQSS